MVRPGNIAIVVLFAKILVLNSAQDCPHVTEGIGVPPCPNRGVGEETMGPGMYGAVVYGSGGVESGLPHGYIIVDVPLSAMEGV
jgi:hypothetical protein